MEPMYYIGLDVHKKKISYCPKNGSGKLAEGQVLPVWPFQENGSPGTLAAIPPGQFLYPLWALNSCWNGWTK